MVVSTSLNLAIKPSLEPELVNELKRKLTVFVKLPVTYVTPEGLV